MARRTIGSLNSALVASIGLVYHWVLGARANGGAGRAADDLSGGGVQVRLADQLDLTGEQGVDAGGGVLKGEKVDAVEHWATAQIDEEFPPFSTASSRPASAASAASIRANLTSSP